MHAAMRIVLGMALASMAACSGSSDERAAAVPAVSLETLTVAPTQVPRLREWDGRIEAIEQATLAAQTGGRVADLSVDVGDVVDEGQVLVRFTTVEQKAGQRQALADLEAARAAASEASTSFRRVQDIYARRLVAKSELDRAEAANDAAQAQLAAARAGLKRADEQVAYTAIRAPYRGVVTARHVQAGETVSPGQALLSGLSLDRLRLRVDVPPAVVQQLNADTPAWVINAHGERIPAERIIVFPHADGSSHQVGVRLDLPVAASGFMPGMSAKAVFQLGDATVLSIPATALSLRGEVESVFVLDAGGRVDLRQVRSGRRFENGDIEILAGLVEGDVVAMDAAAGLEARRSQRAALKEQ